MGGAQACSALQVHQPIPSTPIGIQAPTLPRMITTTISMVEHMQATDPGSWILWCVMMCMVGLGMGVGCIHAWCWWSEQE